MAASVLRRSALVWLCACAGCGWVSKNQFTAIQSQNRTLSEQTKAQLAEIENLKIHSRNVEDQLIRAEEDLARLDVQNGRDRQKMANFRSERERLGNPSASSTGIPAELSDRLEQLARKYPALHYDPKTGISKLDTDVLFDSGHAQLKRSAERMLGEFADILTAPDAQSLKIMIVGHTDDRGIKGREIRHQYPSNWHLSTGRALAVADHLRKAGMADDRMGVAGFGEHQPISANDTAESRQKNRRVEIFVVGPETPVVGWTETLGDLYRR